MHHTVARVQDAGDVAQRVVDALNLACKLEVYLTVHHDLTLGCSRRVERRWWKRLVNVLMQLLLFLRHVLLDLTADRQLLVESMLLLVN